MSFTPGDPVHVAALGKGVVVEVRNGGRCLVEVKGRHVVVAASQLTPLEPPRPTKRTRAASPTTAPSPSPSVAAQPSRHAPSTPASLDLHGKTVNEAVEALDVFLNDALLAGLPEVRVIHGRSGGRVKAASHGRLRALSVVRAFRVDERNAGVTIVTL